MFKVRSLLLMLLLLLFPLWCGAQSANQFFGYYYDDATSYNNPNVPGFEENYNRVNLYHIAFWSASTSDAGRVATANYVLSQLALAKSNGVKAIITASPFVFQYSSTGQWSTDPNASAAWTTFVNQLVSSGYIVPGNPQLSTVAAIYLIDEPDVIGLQDVNGGTQPNPAMANAISAIRGNSNTSTIPIGMITSTSFSTVRHSIELIDWVGFDAYGSSESQWSSLYGQLKSMLTANQKTIIVPKATTGGSCGVGGAATTYDDPWFFWDTLVNDHQVAWLAPFKWFSASSACLGVRDIPSLLTPYQEIGQTMRTISDPSMGEIDTVTKNADGSSSISGWACTQGTPQSGDVDLYVGGAYAKGGVAVGRYLANQPSEPAVASSCRVASGNYRFWVTLTPQQTAQYAGQKIYMYAIAIYGGTNNQIGNSGNLAVP